MHSAWLKKILSFAVLPPSFQQTPKILRKQVRLKHAELFPEHNKNK